MKRILLVGLILATASWAAAVDLGDGVVDYGDSTLVDRTDGTGAHDSAGDYILLEMDNGAIINGQAVATEALLAIWNAGTPKAVFDENGYLHIGGTDPGAYALNVVGAVLIAGDGAFEYNNDEGTVQLKVNNEDSTILAGTTTEIVAANGASESWYAKLMAYDSTTTGEHGLFVDGGVVEGNFSAQYDPVEVWLQLGATTDHEVRILQNNVSVITIDTDGNVIIADGGLAVGVDVSVDAQLFLYGDATTGSPVSRWYNADDENGTTVWYQFTPTDGSYLGFGSDSGGADVIKLYPSGALAVGDDLTVAGDYIQNSILQPQLASVAFDVAAGTLNADDGTGIKVQSLELAFNAKILRAFVIIEQGVNDSGAADCNLIINNTDDQATPTTTLVPNQKPELASLLSYTLVSSTSVPIAHLTSTHKYVVFVYEDTGNTNGAAQSLQGFLVVEYLKI